MGDKYIIELEEKPFHKENGDFLYRVKGFASLVFDLQGLERLTPYIEPDLEQVRLEAEQLGMVRAWGAARKIIHMPEDDLLNVFTECYSAVCTALQAILKYDASEAIEKIRQYEQKKKEIKVGDEVHAPFGTAVVTNIVGDKIFFCYADGHGGFDYKKDKPRKTGRHFPEIAAVLEKMRGEQDGERREE